MSATQILFLIIAAGLALFQILVLWFVHQISKQFPRIRKADAFDGDIEHG